MDIIIDTGFDCVAGNDKNQVMTFINKAHLDARGGFIQTLPDLGENGDNISGTTKWIRQVNHSWSKPCVFRGFHAQRGRMCQAKLVENAGLGTIMFDVIVDARPESKTFGNCKVYPLMPIDSPYHNMLFVPRGFLHGIMSSPVKNSISHLQYYVDNIYSQKDEFSVNPSTVLPGVIDKFGGGGSEMLQMILDGFINTVREGNLEYSEKDVKGLDGQEFMKNVQDEYRKTKKSWWK